VHRVRFGFDDARSGDERERRCAADADRADFDRASKHLGICHGALRVSASREIFNPGVQRDALRYAAVTNSESAESRYALRALAMGIAAIMLGLQISAWLGFVGIIRDGHADFRQLYTAGYMLRSGAGHQIYNYESELAFQNRVVSEAANALPFNHLAYEALIFAPLSVLPFHAAYFVFLEANLALLYFVFRALGPDTSNLRTIWPLLPAALIIMFLPIGACLMQGQDSILLLALLSGGYVLLRRGQAASAGALVACGLFKFQIVIPLAVLSLLAGRKRFALGFAPAAAILTLLSVWIAGVAGTRAYLGDLLGMSVGLSTADQRLRFGIVPTSMANLRGLVYGLSNWKGTAAWTQFAIALVSFAVLLFSVRAMSRMKVSSDAFLLGIVAASLLSYHFLIHDMSILLLPIAVALNRLILCERSPGSVSTTLLWSAALLFAAPVWMAVSARTFFLVAVPILLFLGALGATVARPIAGDCADFSATK
jgi:hypothetical protein